jgi:hypothetical protein
MAPSSNRKRSGCGDGAVLMLRTLSDYDLGGRPGESNRAGLGQECLLRVGVAWREGREEEISQCAG